MMTKTLALLGILIMAEEAMAKPSYEVLSKKGSIAIKSPLDTEWRLLKAKSVPIGSLIRIDPGARIDIALKLDGDKVDRKIRLVQPMITRLDEDLIRRMKTRSYPLKAIWDHGADDKKEAKDSPLLSFASSFFRSIVSLDKSPELPEVKDETPEEEMVQAGAKLLPIEILSPSEDALFFLDGQAKIPVIWSPPKDGLSYKVYAWADGEPRTAPLLTQRESWYTLTLAKAGRYKIQVEDSTHQYRSKAIIFTVDSRLSASGKTQADERDILALEYPVARASILGKGKERLIRFSWHDERELEADERYRLTLVGRGQAPVQKETRQLSEALRVTPGQYTWFVERFSARSTSKSRPRELSFGGESLAKGLTQGRGQTIILDLD
jgi:hypothetical protein